MAKRPKKKTITRRDINEIAASIVAKTTEGQDVNPGLAKKRRKSLICAIQEVKES